MVCPGIVSVPLEKDSGSGSWEGPPSVNDVDQRCVLQAQARDTLIVTLVLASLLTVPDKKRLLLTGSSGLKNVHHNLFCG